MRGDLIAAAVGASIALAVVVAAEVRGDIIEKERAVFSTKCNEFGRIARRIDGMLQCVAPTKGNGDSDKGEGA